MARRFLMKMMTATTAMTRPLGALACVAMLAGCLGPQVDDRVPVGDLVLEAGAAIPTVSDNATLAAQIAANDNVIGSPTDAVIIPRISAYLDGERIWYWDFGPTVVNAIPIYILAREGDTGIESNDGRVFQPIEHSPIIDAVPGDPGYSPLWEVVIIPVTELYDGELMPSFDAIGEGFELQLVEAPVSTSRVINCPVVLPNVRLETADGSQAPDWGYYRGQRIHYFTFGWTLLDEAGQVPVSRAFTLRREGGEPLSETIRGIDINGDGDAADTNNIFETRPGDLGYLGVTTLSEVVLPTDYTSLDTPDAEEPGVTAIDDLFESDLETADPDVVLAVYPSTSTWNLPIEQESAQ